MKRAPRLFPLLTATHRYDKSLSTRGVGHGQVIEAPILAYLLETSNGRILYDVGCDYTKIADPARRARHYDPSVFEWGVPDMREEQRIPHQLARLGLSVADIDVVFVGHLHFDHAGGLCDVRGPEVHVQDEELTVALSGEDSAVFISDISGDVPWKRMHGEYELVPGVRAVSSPGHTVAHMSLYVEPERGKPIVLCGDAADLTENLEHEIAPGLCFREREAEAVESIKKLKRLARETGAELWPNHDMAFYRQLPPIHEFRIGP